MEGVRIRPGSALIALLALLLLAAPAVAQQERPRGVQDVYDDYEDDGVIEGCEHTERALQRTLDGLAPEADVDTPDLRPMLEAAIEQLREDDCPEVVEEEPTPSPTRTPAPAAPAPAAPAPAPTAAPAPAAPATPPATSTPDSSDVAPLPGGGGGDGGSGGGNTPPTREDVAPLPEAPPAAAPVPPAEPSGPPPEPPTVFNNDDDAVPVSLLVLAGVIALCALLALVYALLSRLGLGERYLLPVRRAGREARFRAGGTWGDFADWMRVGR